MPEESSPTIALAPVTDLPVEVIDVPAGSRRQAIP